MKIKVCIGSSCHLKGSRNVVESLQNLIKDNNLKDSVDLSGVFCMGRCKENGVSVSVDDKLFSVVPDDVEDFFENEIKAKL